jgi:hypothetical protein
MKKKIVKVLFGTIGTIILLWGLGSCGSMADTSSAPENRNMATEIATELLKQTSRLVSDAERSIGMTSAELEKYWGNAKLLRISDDAYGMSGYPDIDIVVATMFVFADGRVSLVHYSFGNYSSASELLLKAALTRRLGNPEETSPDGVVWRKTQTGGNRLFFVFLKEEYAGAESGFILSFICIQKDV